MNNKDADKKIYKHILAVIYGIGIILWIAGWIAGWYWFGSSDKFSSYRLFLIPFILCIVILFLNLRIWWSYPKYTDEYKYKTELRVAEFVDRDASYIVLAISVIILVVNSISQGDQQTIPILRQFYIFQFLALASLIIGVLPFYWIPSDKISWLIILRHIKTVPYSYAVSFFLAGLISISIQVVPI